jgi:Uma2 family endonuclease
MTRPPDVVVEILSQGQSRREMRAKVDAYVAFGVASVWVIDAERKSVDVYEGGRRRTLAGDDVLESPAAPGFRVTLSELLD